jgi:hypothetical protein
MTGLFGDSRASALRAQDGGVGNGTHASAWWMSSVQPWEVTCSPLALLMLADLGVCHAAIPVPIRREGAHRGPYRDQTGGLAETCSILGAIHNQEQYCESCQVFRAWCLLPAITPEVD